MKSFSFKGLADQAKAAGSKLAAATPTFEQLQAYRRTDESVPGLDAAALAQLPPQQAVAVLQEQNAQLRSALLTERQKAISDDSALSAAPEAGTSVEPTLAEKKLQSQAQRLERLNTTLKAKVEMLRSNLAEVRDDAERASVFEKQVEFLKEQLQEASASVGQPLPTLQATGDLPGEAPTSQGDDGASHENQQQLARLLQRLDEALAANRSAAQQQEEQAVAKAALQQRLEDAERQAASAAAAAAGALNQQLASELVTSSIAATSESGPGDGSQELQASSHMRELLEAKEGALQDASEQVAALLRQHQEDAKKAASLLQQLHQMQPEPSQQGSAVSALETQLESASAETAREKEQVAALMQQLSQRDIASIARSVQETDQVSAAEAVSADLRLQLKRAMQEVQDATDERAVDAQARRDATRRANDFEAEQAEMRTTIRKQSANAADAAAAEKALQAVQERCRNLETKLQQLTEESQAAADTEESAALEARCKSAQEAANSAEERLALARTRCTELEEALATAQSQAVAGSAHENKELPMEMLNGSDPAVVTGKVVPHMATVDAAPDTSAERIELQEQLADVKRNLVREREHSAALQEDATRSQASLAEAVEAAQTAAAAAEASKSEITSRCENLAARLKDSEDACTSAVAERNAAAATAATELDTAVAKAHASNAAAEADARAEAAAAVTALEEATSGQEEAHAKLKDLEQQAATAEASAEAAQADLNAADRPRIDRAADDTADTEPTPIEQQLREEASTIRAELLGVREELASAAAAAATAAEQAHTAEQQRDSLQEQLADRDAALRAGDDERIASLGSLQSQLADARAAAETADAAAAAAQSEISAAVEAQSQAEATLHEAMREAEREQEATTRALNDAVAQVSSGQNALAAREESMMQLANQLEEIRSAAREAEDNEERWASERQSLQERIQRLQKVNKDRRVELDEAHANLVAAKAGAQQVDALRVRAAEVEPLQASLADARATVQAAEVRLREEATSRREFLVKFQERSRAAVGEQQALQRQMDGVRERLTASTAAAAEGARWRGEAEAAREKSAMHSATAARLEDQLRHSEGELDVTLATLEQERADHAHGLTAAQSQLDSLLDSDRSAWPASVRSVVASAETAASESAAAEARQIAEGSEAELEDEMDRLRSAADVAKDALADALRAKHAAEEQSDRVAEDAQQEAAAAAQQLAQMQAGFETRTAALHVQLETADAATSATQEDVKFWSAQAEEAQTEIASVRERAQALMAEKDMQIEQAKMRWSSPGSRSPSPELPVSSILRHEDSMPLGKSRSVSFAEIQPASPTTPTRQVGMNDNREVDKLMAQLKAMQADLADRQHTEILRDQAADVLKEEVDEMRRREKRNAVDLNYVKGVLVSGFESNELSVHSSMLPVLARLLQFTPGDMRRLSLTKNKEWLPPWQP